MSKVVMKKSGVKGSFVRTAKISDDVPAPMAVVKDRKKQAEYKPKKSDKAVLHAKNIGDLVIEVYQSEGTQAVDWPLMLDKIDKQPSCVTEVLGAIRESSALIEKARKVAERGKNVVTVIPLGSTVHDFSMTKLLLRTDKKLTWRTEYRPGDDSIQQTVQSYVVGNLINVPSRVGGVFNHPITVGFSMRATLRVIPIYMENGNLGFVTHPVIPDARKIFLGDSDAKAVGAVIGLNRPNQQMFNEAYQAMVRRIAKAWGGQSNHVTRFVKMIILWVRASEYGTVTLNSNMGPPVNATARDSNMAANMTGSNEAYISTPEYVKSSLNLFLVASAFEHPCPLIVGGGSMVTDTIVIPADGQRIHLIGEGKPLLPPTATYTAAEIKAYIFAYAMHIRSEESVGVAVAIVSMMIRPDLTFSMSLPPVKSYLDVLQPAIAPRTQDPEHLVVFDYSRMICMGTVLGCGAAQMYKDLVMHYHDHRGVCTIDMVTHGNTATRREVCSFFCNEMLGEGFELLPLLDIMRGATGNTGNGGRMVNQAEFFSTVTTRSIWLMWAGDQKCVLAHTVTEILMNGHFDPARGATDIDLRINSFLRQLNIGGSDVRCKAWQTPLPQFGVVMAEGPTVVADITCILEQEPKATDIYRFVEVGCEPEGTLEEGFTTEELSKEPESDTWMGDAPAFSAEQKEKWAKSAVPTKWADQEDWELEAPDPNFRERHMNWEIRTDVAVDDLPVTRVAKEPETGKLMRNYDRDPRQLAAIIDEAIDDVGGSLPPSKMSLICVLGGLNNMVVYDGLGGLDAISCVMVDKQGESYHLPRHAVKTLSDVNTYLNGLSHERVAAMEIINRVFVKICGYKYTSLRAVYNDMKGYAGTATASMTAIEPRLRAVLAEPGMYSRCYNRLHEVHRKYGPLSMAVTKPAKKEQSSPYSARNAGGKP